MKIQEAKNRPSGLDMIAPPDYSPPFSPSDSELPEAFLEGYSSRLLCALVSS